LAAALEKKGSLALPQARLYHLRHPPDSNSHAAQDNRHPDKQLQQSQCLSGSRQAPVHLLSSWYRAYHSTPSALVLSFPRARTPAYVWLELPPCRWTAVETLLYRHHVPLRRTTCKHLLQAWTAINTQGNKHIGLWNPSRQLSPFCCSRSCFADSDGAQGRKRSLPKRSYSRSAHVHQGVIHPGTGLGLHLGSW
jgi:hypothetical protein